MNKPTLELLLAVFFLGSVKSSPISIDSVNDTSLNEILYVDQQLYIAIQSNDWTSTNPVEAFQPDFRATQSKLMQSFMNTSINPCENFYDYACGNWEKMNPIPNDKWKFSTTQALQRDLLYKLKELLSEAIDENEMKADPPSAINKAKLFYKNCLKQEAASKPGNETLLEYLKNLGGFPLLDENWSKEKFDWLQLSIDTAYVGNGIMIAFDVVRNPTVPTNYTIYLKQTTLGLINRDNYVKKENAKNLEAYRLFVKKVLLLLNIDEQKAQNASDEIVDFEVKLANATLPMEATKSMSFYQLNITELSKGFRYIDWKKYISGIQGAEAQMNQTVVMQLGVKYFENLYFLLKDTKKITLANYMMWRCMLFVINNLGSSFRATLDELTKTVTGQVEPVALWQHCVSQVNGAMGMAVSAMFIRKYFDESSKNETIKMINSIKESFNETLYELDWLDESTKTYAREKAEAMQTAAGYPEYVRSEESLNKLYKDVQIVAGNHFENFLSVIKHNWRKNRDRIFKAFERNQWHLPPTIVNALYDFGANRMLILAGILQPPIYHQDHPQSVNYGAIGMFIGHEIIHGFDDTGRKFDSGGCPYNWWSPKSLSHFEEKKKCFLSQYENLSKEDESFKSIATIGENLADNGGIRLAYKAYMKWKRTNGVMADTFWDMALSEDQLFFLSFAQTFCAAIRPEALVESKGYEAHSPERYRIRGALMNFEKFSEAFKCPLGSRYNPIEKCRLW